MLYVKPFTPRNRPSILATIALTVAAALAMPAFADSLNPKAKNTAKEKAPPVKNQPAPITAIPYKGPLAQKASASTTEGRIKTTATEPFPKTGGFSIDVSSRQQSQAFFNSVYTASENTPLTFTGDVASCSPGTTNALFKDAVLLRINWFREMAGVTDNITFTPGFNASAQDASLIMAANGLLTHTPPSSLTCYTASGDDAAGSSNLALGTLGWNSITGYIEDGGSNNAAVGHRRWLLHPPTEEMGTGDIPATATTSATNSIWVFDDNIFANGPMRDGYVAWPPPGYVPHTVVPARWSFSLRDANFNNATVSMTRNGSAISTTLEPVSSGAGLDTLVWIPLGLDADNAEPWPQPTSDETLSVQLNNVLVDGVPTAFNYDVQIFDSAVAGANDEIPTITGPVSGELVTAERFGLSEVSFAEGYLLRGGTLSNLTAIEDAEGSQEFVTDLTDSAYPLFSTGAAANGSFSLHLAHSTPTDQQVIIERQVFPSASSQLRFSSRLGFASVTQIARAQVSLDDGQTWADVYTQAGTDGSGETSFTARSVSLGAYADSVIKVRFAYDLLGGSYFPQFSAGVGFYIDDVEITNAQELGELTTTELSTVSEFSYTPETLGEHLLQIQYLGFEGFAGSAWGPPMTFDVGTSNNTTALAASVLPASRSVFDATATAFATIINGGSETATDCRLVPQTNTPTSFTYQTTNPATNGLTGTANTPVDIAPGDFQTFAFFFDPVAAFNPIEVVISFDCTNSAPAPVTNGLNTLLLSSGSGPVPDIIALAATITPGIVEIQGTTGTGLFAVATLNAGVAGTITASATGTAGVSVQICETNPTTGACISAVGPTVTTSIAADATPTFAFFVTGSGNVPFDPANNRVSVVFTDASGITRGATSVAMRTN